MGAFVRPFATPISRSDSPDYGWAWGTGTYCWVPNANSAFLLTNSHVAAAGEENLLAHLPSPGSEFEAILTPFTAWPEPIDFACAPIDIARLSSERDCLAPEQFDQAYSPVPHELLFWLGFPATTLDRWDSSKESKIRYSWGGELSVPAVPLLTQAYAEEISIAPERFDASVHQLIHYPEHAQEILGGSDKELHNPRGMSGSLLWDTKRIACHHAGVEWQPEFARVCGLVWAAGELSPFMNVTRIEHIIACLSSLGPPPAP